MKKNIILLMIPLFTSLIACRTKKKVSTTEKLPNIVIIYMDDLGYGDVGAYGETEIKTPNIDQLAHNGLQFSNGYASSATCSPSRYALLTGVYPWRNKNAKILPGTAPLLIDTVQITLPKMLKEKGYTTGVVGKWHLGLGNGHIDWNRHIAPGPREVGFDYSYIMAATVDRVPTVYIENGDVCGLDPNDPIEVSYKKNFPGEPTGKDHPEMLKMMYHHGHAGSIVNGISRIGFMKGGQAARWVDENMADTFLVKAKKFVMENKGRPFFLYYALHEPHVPRVPNPRFVGKTNLGPRGDVIVEADWCIGELLKTLDKEGLLDNTFIIFSSDNGPVLNDGYYDQAVERNDSHKPAGPLRGGKYSLYEGGTRVPFITYWKGHIQPGKSDAMVSQVDLLSSLAALTGSPERSKDGLDMLNVLLGKSQKGRNQLIEEATTRTALRKGKWKMIPPYPGPVINKHVNIELGNSNVYQLYNLQDDIGEQNNLAEKKEQKLKEMMQSFEKIRGENYKKTEKLILK